MSDIAINQPCGYCEHPIRVFDSFVPWRDTVVHVRCWADDEDE